MPANEKIFPTLIFVEVDDEPIIPATTYTNNGTPRLVPAKQRCYLWGGKKYPVEFTVVVDDAKGPLRPGKYLLGGPVFSPGQYGLEFRGKALELIPAEEALKALTSSPRIAAAA